LSGILGGILQTFIGLDGDECFCIHIPKYILRYKTVKLQSSPKR
jgi:hypothetical protein